MDTGGKKIVSLLEKNWKWTKGVLGLLLAVSILALTLAVVADVVAWNASEEHGALIWQRDGTLADAPVVQTFGAGGAPLTIRVPVDLSAHVGRVYKMYAATAHAHTLHIEPGSDATWGGGGFKTATLGGARGDGLSFVVVAPNLIVVEHVINVVFS